jgi:NAD(P)H-hydrate epimerase
LPQVLVLCGSGNNGGDGGVVARHLDAWGFPVRVIWFARQDQLRGDAAVQWAILERSGVDQSAWHDAHPGDEVDPAVLAPLLAPADWLVDGLLGTGLSRPVEGPLRTAIEVMNHAGKPVFALDLPSGLDADTGKPLGVAVRADATATFVAAKLGFSAPGATDYTGEIAVIDIGLPRCLLEPFFDRHGHSVVK